MTDEVLNRPPACETAPAPRATPRGAAANRRSPGRRVMDAMGRRVRRLTRLLDRGLTRLAVKSGWGACLYYACCSSKFRREQQAVLAGRLRFQEDAEAPRNSAALLRRGVHRLEKGLLMRPRRPVFALDYIEETFACYEKLHSRLGHAEIDRLELAWAYDVLSAYFDCTADHPRINPLRDRFRSLAASGGGDACTRVPYRRDLSVPVPVTYAALLELAIRRRSVRWFLQQQVPRELLVQAVEVATQSPSACNRQPFQFHIMDDPELAHRVGAIPAGTAGFSHNFPAVIVVVGRLRAYFDERDRHVIYIDGSLASMSLVFALETLGLSTCCINWPDIEDREREMDRVLKLEPDERPIMLIAVGYPDPEGLVAYSQKKPVSQLCRFNLE